MTPQPRDVTSGQWRGRSNTGPDVRLAATKPPPAPEEIAERLENISTILRDIARIRDVGFASFLAEGSLFQLAAVGALIQWGEQANKLGADFIERNPGPEYRKAVSSRNRLAHSFDVDPEILWQTVSESARLSAEAHEHVRRKHALRSDT